MGMSNQRASGLVGSTNIDAAGPNLNYSQGGGKTSIQKAMNSVVQVNPSQITQLYQQGADDYKTYALEGLDYYQNALTQAAQQVQLGFDQSNATLKPLSVAGYSALNQQLKFLGLPGVSQSAGSASMISTAFGDKYSDIQQQINAAEKLTSGAERQAALKNIQDTIQSRITDTTQLQKNYDNITGILTPEEIDAKVNSIIGPRYKASSTGAEIKQINADAAAMKAELTAQNDRAIKEQQALKNQIDTLNSQNADLTTIGSRLGTTFDTSDLTPYTGAEAEAQLASTPGYQFALNQGTDAISRQSAASGLLGSGNMQAALLEYGQGLANNTFNSYMANLANISGMGANATQNIAANQANAGQSLGSLTSMGGAAGAQTYNSIGQAYQQSANAQAQARQQIAMYNASMQYNSKQANLNRAQTASTAALAATPGLMNAGVNAAQFGYFQNQQASQAMGLANNAGGLLPSGYWGNMV